MEIGMSNVYEFPDARPGVRAIAKFEKDVVYIDSLDLSDVCIDREAAVGLVAKLLAWIGSGRMGDYCEFVANGGVSIQVKKPLDGKPEKNSG